MQEAGSRVILCSHLGRPKGEKVEKFTLKPVTCSPDPAFRQRTLLPLLLPPPQLLVLRVARCGHALPRH